MYVKDENSMSQASTTNPTYTQATVNPSYAQTTPAYPLYSGNQYTDNTQQNPGMDNTQQQQPTLQTKQQQATQTPDIRLQNNNLSSGTLLPPYIVFFHFSSFHYIAYCSSNTSEWLSWLSFTF